MIFLPSAKKGMENQYSRIYEVAILLDEKRVERYKKSLPAITGPLFIAISKVYS